MVPHLGCCGPPPPPTPALWPRLALLPLLKVSLVQYSKALVIKLLIIKVKYCNTYFMYRSAIVSELLFVHVFYLKRPFFQASTPHKK